MGWKDAPLATSAPRWAAAPKTTVPLEDQLPLTSEQEAALPPKTNAPMEEKSWWQQLKDKVEGDPVLQQLLSVGGTVAGAPEVAATGINNLLVKGYAGLSAPVAAAVGEAPNGMANYIEDTEAQNAHQLQGESAQKLGEGMGLAMEPVANLKSVTLDPLAEQANKIPVVGPAIATGIDKGLEMAATVLPVTQFGKGATVLEKGIPITKPNVPAPKPSVPLNPATKLARDADMHILPSEVQAGAPAAKNIPGQIRQDYLSDAKTINTMRLHNQVRSTQMAGEEIGLQKATQLGEKQFDTLEAPLIEKYRAAESTIDKIGPSKDLAVALKQAKQRAGLLEDPKASITRTIGALRRKAAKRIQNDDAKIEAQGYADKRVADRLEAEFGKQLEGMGDAAAFTEYKAAREAFAKINDVRTATKAGQVDVAILNKLKKKGAPLSGKLDMLADIAEAHPQSTKHSLSTAKGATATLDRAGLLRTTASAATRTLAPKFSVSSPKFQAKLGKALSPQELDNLAAQYRQKPGSSPAKPLNLYDTVPFEATPGVNANAVNAERMAGDLSLQRDPAMGVIEFPQEPATIAAMNEAQLAQALRTSRPPPKHQSDLGLELRDELKLTQMSKEDAAKFEAALAEKKRRQLAEALRR